MTNAQIELMAADVSVVDYDYGDDKKKKKRKKWEFDDTKANAESVKKAADEWVKKYGDKGEKAGWCNLKDVLGGNMTTGVGIKIE